MSLILSFALVLVIGCEELCSRVGPVRYSWLCDLCFWRDSDQLCGWRDETGHPTRYSLRDRSLNIAAAQAVAAATSTTTQTLYRGEFLQLDDGWSPGSLCKMGGSRKTGN
jgi:hypothetical protein